MINLCPCTDRGSGTCSLNCIGSRSSQLHPVVSSHVGMRVKKCWQSVCLMISSCTSNGVCSSSSYRYVRASMSYVIICISWSNSGIDYFLRLQAATVNISLIRLTKSKSSRILFASSALILREDDSQTDWWRWGCESSPPPPSCSFCLSVINVNA